MIRRGLSLALLAVLTSALPGCVFAMDTDDDPPADRDAELTQLETRMDRIEQALPK